MSPFAREIFRRIALGLPLAGVGPGSVLVATLTACPCPGAPAPVRRGISGGELAAITRADGGVDPDLCRELCARIEDRTTPPDGSAADAGPLELTSQASSYSRCSLVEPAPSSVIECQAVAPRCIGGRAPSGLRPLEPGPSSLGEHFARSAWFEAASAFAFEELAHELGMHGAPRWLVGRAWTAAKDERRHARLFADLAGRAGTRVPAVERHPNRPRSLDALAEDNATEGLAREAFAALVAAHQARHATNVHFARACATIVADEAQHALLSADVHEWATERMGPGARARCDERRRAMLGELARGLDGTELGSALGLPDTATRASFALVLA